MRPQRKGKKLNYEETEEEEEEEIGYVRSSPLADNRNSRAQCLYIPQVSKKKCMTKRLKLLGWRRHRSCAHRASEQCFPWTHLNNGNSIYVYIFKI